MALFFLGLAVANAGFFINFTLADPNAVMAVVNGLGAIGAAGACWAVNE